MELIFENIGTIAVALVLALIIGATAVCVIKDRKAGKTSCSGGCSNCPFGGKCGK